MAIKFFPSSPEISKERFVLGKKEESTTSSSPTTSPRTTKLSKFSLSSFSPPQSRGRLQSQIAPLPNLLNQHEEALERMLLLHQNLRDEVINGFMEELDMERTIRFRFFTAMAEIKRERDASEAKRKEQAVWRMFFESKLCRLSPLPPELETQVWQDKSDKLLALFKIQKWIAQDFVQHQGVIKIMIKSGFLANINQ